MWDQAIVRRLWETFAAWVKDCSAASTLPLIISARARRNCARPGFAVLRAGTLDRSNELKIAAHIWAKRKMHGIAIPEDTPSWPEGAPPADLIAAISR